MDLCLEPGSARRPPRRPAHRRFPADLRRRRWDAGAGRACADSSLPLAGVARWLRSGRAGWLDARDEALAGSAFPGQSANLSAVTAAQIRYATATLDRRERR